MVLTYVKLNLHFTDKALRTAEQTKIHIVSLYTLAFIAGSMNMIYQVERLPLMVAILIHGMVLYISYIATYLVNGWLEWGITPVVYFTVIFLLCYLAIWVVIYTITKRNTDKLNRILRQKQAEEKIGKK